MPLVGDSHEDRVFILGHPDDGAGTSGVAMNIRQAFLHDTKQRSFNICCQASNIAEHQQLDLYPATLDEAAHKPLQSGQETGFVKEWRVKQIRQSSELFDDLIAERQALFQCFHSTCPLALNYSSHAGKVRPDGYHVLHGYVMKIACDSPAFLVLCAQEQAAQLLLSIVRLFDLRYIFVRHHKPPRAARIEPLHTHLKP